ncbi:biotin--[acetyl-CoA-carboxylase] ligase [Cellulosilyticum ruminicola]|uniref:biotin--[acetyl-CoA-carboxylase] ligase n=1 Tax=Cellulosilyticum ruminicola TaxID=425254 RepID=UPI0006D2B323|nr:biotin--[acetyl-CoA-carboxylase] ligase [Cellulosilyticum ruminicola]
MKEKVLKYLKEQKEYVSGEQISKKLGVTRASIWKIINKLKEEGYMIESSTKKGYKLMEVPNIITKEEVQSIIKTQCLGKNINYFSEIDSTNEIVKKLARKGEAEGTIVIADKQTAGKGRLGRVWESPSGVNIFMSILLRPQIKPDKASQITLIVGLAMCEAIREVTGLDARIKWPNDIVVNGKKVCGILTEMSAEIDCVNYVVVGIGVNVNQMEFSENLPHATSLKIEGGKEYQRGNIISVFFDKFESYYMAYKTDITLEPILPAYKTYCITLADKVKIIDSIQEYIAEPVDVLADGSLVVKNEEGEEKRIFTGEVSVRGIYGYV